MSKPDLKVELDPRLVSWAVKVRRELHRHPELAYHETRTAKTISRELSGMDIPHRAGVGKTGVVGLIMGNAGPVVALRADMDALPIEEKTGLAFCSEVDGLMHACGHDVNMAVVLGTAKHLVDSGLSKELKRGVKLIFQPAEESGAGAKVMVEEGVLEDPEVTAVLGCHLFPDLALGSVGYTPKTAYAGSDRISLTIEGKGGHAARPQDAIDPIVAGAYFVTQVQSVVSRSLDPRDAAVVTIGSFQSGTASNVIPETAELSGTLRTFSPEVRERAMKRIRELALSLEFGFGVSCRLDIIPGYPPCPTDPDLSNLLAEVSRELLGDDKVSEEPPSMGSEDFAYYSRIVPGAILRIGCKGSGPLHSPQFNPDERVIEIGIRIMVGALKRLLT